MPKDDAFSRAIGGLSGEASRARVAKRLPKHKQPVALMISIGLAPQEALEEAEGDHELGDEYDGEPEDDDFEE